MVLRPPDEKGGERENKHIIYSHKQIIEPFFCFESDIFIVLNSMCHLIFVVVVVEVNIELASTLVVPWSKPFERKKKKAPRQAFAAYFCR